MSVWADKRKTISLTAESSAQDALLYGFPRGHLTSVAVVCLDAAIKLGNLLARHRDFRRVRGQIIPQLADKKKLFGWRQLIHAGDGLDNHWKAYLRADCGASLDNPPTLEIRKKVRRSGAVRPFPCPPPAVSTRFACRFDQLKALNPSMGASPGRFGGYRSRRRRNPGVPIDCVPVGRMCCL